MIKEIPREILGIFVSRNMKTRLITIEENKIDQEKIGQIAEALAEGKLVAFPTETVYGIGANALSEDAAAKIYLAKGRPSDNPLIVHLAEWEQLENYVTGIGNKAKILAEHFWPGPLTMVFHKKDNIPATITGGLNTVGIRIPVHPVAAAILKACQLPIAAPSANISGKPSPTEFEHVCHDLDGRVDIIVQSGSANVGLESTVIDMTGEVPVILRPGGISKESIEEVIGKVEMNTGLSGESQIPVAPGMKYRHYAPSGKLHLLPLASFEENCRILLEKMLTAKQEGRKVAAMVPTQYLEYLKDFECFDLGDKDHLEEIARHLFDGLRYMDREQIEEIYSLSYRQEGIGEAIMNRLTKASVKDAR